jgi:hypothetical protein
VHCFRQHFDALRCLALCTRMFAQPSVELALDGCFPSCLVGLRGLAVRPAVLIATHLFPNQLLVNASRLLVLVIVACLLILVIVACLLVLVNASCLMVLVNASRLLVLVNASRLLVLVNASRLLVLREEVRGGAQRV